MSDTIRNPGLKNAVATVRYDLLTLDTTNNYPYMVQTSADTDIALVVALAAAAAEEELQYMPIGGHFGVARAGAAISEGDNIAPTTTGEVKTAASGDQVMGKAMEAASGANVEFRVFFYHGWLLA